MVIRSLPLPPIKPLAQGPPAQNLPTLWAQLEPFRQQGLAQRLAEMIRRIRVETCPTAQRPREEVANDNR